MTVSTTTRRIEYVGNGIQTVFPYSFRTLDEDHIYVYLDGSVMVLNADYTVDGVPGNGGKITLHFVHPGGSITKKLLPTGNVRDDIDVPDIGKINVFLNFS